MRKLTFSAVALATLIASGSAFAADEASRAAADAEAQSGGVVQSIPQHQLGYAAQSRAEHPAFVALSTTQEQSPISAADRLFLQQGDRGIGND